MVLSYGQYGLPMSNECPLCMVLGDFIKNLYFMKSFVNKIDNPTPIQIDTVHNNLLQGIDDIFEQHKRFYGWDDIKLQFT